MNRSTAFLLGLLLILGVIVFFFLPREGERESSEKTGEIHIVVDSSSTIKIEIQRPKKSVTLENVGGKWTITSPLLYAADQNAVHQLLGGLSRFKTGSLISSNPEKQRLFEVDSSGTRLSVTDRSGKVTSFIIGKMGPSFSEVYFRLPESKEVYLGQGVDTWTFSKEIKDWRDKSIVSAPSEIVRGLTYTVGSKQYSFHKDSSGWKSGEKTLDASAMNPALNTLASLNADDFVDTAMAMNSRPIALRINGAEDVTLNLYPSLPDSAHYYVQRGNGNQFFVINKFTAQQLLKPIEQPGVSSHIAAVTAPKTIQSPPPAPIIVPKPQPVIAEKKEAPKQSPPQSSIVEKKEEPKKETLKDVSGEGEKKEAPPVKTGPTRQLADPGQSKRVAKTQPSKEIPAQQPTPNPSPAPGKAQPKVGNADKNASSAEEEGELTVYAVKRGETMTTIATRFGVTVEQILKWNLLKSISVKPGQELYIYVRK